MIMKEILKIRLANDDARRYFRDDIGKLSGDVRVLQINKQSVEYDRVRLLDCEKKEKHIFYSWEFQREYTQQEWDSAALLHMFIKKTFEPDGENCGTVYDETAACSICGANRIQKNDLHLQRRSIPKKDIARTLPMEIVVSKWFVEAVKKWGIRGCVFLPVMHGEMQSEDYFQLKAEREVTLSLHTVAGVTPFDFTEISENGEVFRCPLGHTIGLRLVSEVHVIDALEVHEYDFMASKQKIGMRQGVYRPEPIYLVSPRFKRMIDEEQLSGFKFEVAHIDKV